MSRKGTTTYRGYTITPQRGGYTVSKGGHVETSQPLASLRAIVG
jgi:hypothetical protein